MIFSLGLCGGKHVCCVTTHLNCSLMTSAVPEAPPNLKLLLIGNSSVGKSSLLTRFTDASFTPEDESSATIGVDFRVCKMEIKGKRVKLSIWVGACPFTLKFDPPLNYCRTQQVNTTPHGVLKRGGSSLAND